LVQVILTPKKSTFITSIDLPNEVLKRIIALLIASSVGGRGQSDPGKCEVN
jgi:hypothetical protein